MQLAEEFGLVIDVFDDILEDDEVEPAAEVFFDIYIIYIADDVGELAGCQFGFQPFAAVDDTFFEQFNADTDAAFVDEGFEDTGFAGAYFQYPCSFWEGEGFPDEGDDVFGGIGYLDVEVLFSVLVEFKHKMAPPGGCKGGQGTNFLGQGDLPEGGDIVKSLYVWRDFRKFRNS